MLYIEANFLVRYYKKLLMLELVFLIALKKHLEFYGCNGLGLQQSRRIENQSIFFHEHPKQKLPFLLIVQQEEGGRC